MQVNEGIVVQDLRMVGRNEPHAPHVSPQSVDLINTLGGLQTILPVPKIKQQKLIGSSRPELRGFQIYTPNPVSLTFEVGYQVMTNKASGSGNDNFTTVRHGRFLL